MATRSTGFEAQSEEGILHFVARSVGCRHSPAMRSLPPPAGSLWHCSLVLAVSTLRYLKPNKCTKRAKSLQVDFADTLFLSDSHAVLLSFQEHLEQRLVERNGL